MSDTKTENKNMITCIKVYDLIKINCPSGMNVENCPLRQELAKIPQTEHSECDTLPNGDLIVPYYLPKNDEKFVDLGCIHVKSMCIRMCEECRSKQR